MKIRNRNRRQFIANVEQVENRCLLSTAPQFTVKDLGPTIYPFGYEDSGGNINSSGQIIATSPNGTRPIMSGPNGGQFRFLTDSMAIGISVNDSGMATGAYRGSSTQPYRTFKYDPTSGSMDIDLPSGSNSKGLGINNLGNIVGAFNATSSAPEHAFFYDGCFHDIGTLGGSPTSSSAAYSINNSNQITGWTDTLTTNSTGNGAHLAFFYSNGVMHSLGSLGHNTGNPDGYSEAFGINSLGQVVGDSMVGTNLPYHGFISDPNGGTLHDVGTIPGATVPYLFSVNDHGESVGYASMTDGSSHGIYSNGHTMMDLNNLIPQGSGFVIVSAHGINNSDQISAIGVDSIGQTHALFLTLIPQTPVAPKITWSNPADIVYGTPLSTTQLDATASVPGTFTYTPAAGTVLHAGAAQTLSATFTPDDTTDYTTVTTTASINVLQAPLTITANNATKIYGASVPSLAVSYSGFVNGDTVASLTTSATATTSATSASPVGSYAITPSGAVNPDYAITYVNGTLAITPAPLTIKADNAYSQIGFPIPPLTGTITGLVNGDTDIATYTTTATQSSYIGNYPIVPHLADPNYNITIVNGTLTIGYYPFPWPPF